MKKRAISGVLSLFMLGAMFIMPSFSAKAESINSNTDIERSFKKPATGFWGYIEGTNVNFRSSPKISSNNSIRYFSNYEVVAIEELDSGTSNGHQWSKVTDKNGVTGYVASEFLYTEGD